ncbi:MAG: hypothetical protein AABZ15_16610 [Nitrospirota bacterium]
MKTADIHGNTKTTGRSAKGRGLVSLLITLSGIVAALAGPLFGGRSNAWAQLDASRQSAFRLVGTIEGGPFTGAVIDDTKNPQAFYRLHEKLPDESQIVKVQSDSIVLKWPDGTRTELYATPGSGGGSAHAGTAAAAPSASPRPVDQPAPARIANPDRIRPEQVPSAGIGQDAAGRRPSRMDRQNPNQQGAQVQDPGARRKGGGGRRNRPRSIEDD